MCDNAAVVTAVNKGLAKDPNLAHLHRTLAFTTAVLDNPIRASYLAGVHNTSAYALHVVNFTCSFLSIHRHSQ